jgi:hypothetical protein
VPDDEAEPIALRLGDAGSTVQSTPGPLGAGISAFCTILIRSPWRRAV